MSNGDPIGSDKPRGKSNAKRMGRYDGSFTPTEQRKKDKLMRQFMKTGEGVGGNSDAYRNAQCWCACGRLKMTGRDECLKCLEAAVEAPLEALRNEAAERKYDGAVGCMGAPTVLMPLGRCEGWHRDAEGKTIADPWATDGAKSVTTGALCPHGIGNLTACEPCGRVGIESRRPEPYDADGSLWRRTGKR